jgi:hypothetical protein
MTIGVLLSAIGAALLAVATAVALESSLAIAGLAYVLGGSLGVTVFVALAEFQRRPGPAGG